MYNSFLFLGCYTWSLGYGSREWYRGGWLGDLWDRSQLQPALTYLASWETSTCSDWSSWQIHMTEASGLSSGKNVRRRDHRVRWPTSGCCSSVASLQRKGMALVNIKVEVAEARVSKFPLHIMLHPWLTTPLMLSRARTQEEVLRLSMCVWVCLSVLALFPSVNNPERRNCLSFLWLPWLLISTWGFNSDTQQLPSGTSLVCLMKTESGAMKERCPG